MTIEAMNVITGEVTILDEDAPSFDEPQAVESLQDEKARLLADASRIMERLAQITKQPPEASTASNVGLG
jgi:hypothetical protein